MYSSLYIKLFLFFFFSFFFRFFLLFNFKFSIISLVHISFFTKSWITQYTTTLREKIPWDMRQYIKHRHIKKKNLKKM